MVLAQQDDRHGFGVLGRDERIGLRGAERIDPIVVLIDLPDTREARRLLILDFEPSRRIAGAGPIAPARGVNLTAD